MLKINKKTEYALMALKYMGEQEKGSLVTVREICDALKTPFDTTAKVMQAMNHNGLLKSMQGIRGGYTLSKGLEEISYMEVTKIAEGIQEESVCQTNKGLCTLHATCNIITPIDRLNNKLMIFLGQVNLHELFFEDPESSKTDLKKILGIN